MLVLIAIFLLTAVVVVPLFRRLRLGSVLGYIAAGMLIGPWCLGVVPQSDGTLHFAELGVVLLLFLIGLELEPSRLWALRRSVFGLGARRSGVTASCSPPSRIGLGLAWQPALVVGLRPRDVVDRDRAALARRARAALTRRTGARRSRSCCSRTSR